MKFKSRSLGVAFVILVGISTNAFAQFTFDKPKSEGQLKNPYTLGAKRENIVKAVDEILKACSFPVDTIASRPIDGKIVTTNVIFTRGVTAQSDLEHLATLPSSQVRNWLQGRFILEITSLPLDQDHSQLQVSARLQGRMAGVAEGERWINGVSNGTLEDEVIRAIAGKVLGIDLSLYGKGKRRIANCEY